MKRRRAPSRRSTTTASRPSAPRRRRTTKAGAGAPVNREVASARSVSTDARCAVFRLPDVWLRLYAYLDDADVSGGAALCCRHWCAVVRGDVLHAKFPSTRPPRKRAFVAVLPSAPGALADACRRPLPSAAYSLSLRGCNTGSLEDNARLLRAGLAGVAGGGSLRALDLSGFPLSDDAFERLVAPAHVNTVARGGHASSDVAFGCPSLTRINLGAVPASAKGRSKPQVRLLARLKRLRVVSLSRIGNLHGCWVTAVSKAVPKLECLCLSGCRAMGCKGVFTAAQKVANLRVLHATNVRLAPAALVPDACVQHAKSKPSSKCSCPPVVRLVSAGLAKKPPKWDKRARVPATIVHDPPGAGAMPASALGALPAPWHGIGAVGGAVTRELRVLCESEDE